MLLSMKKVSLFVLLGISLVLVGCGSSPDEAAPKGEFAVDTCNKYFEFAQCTLKDLPAEQQEATLGELDAMKEQWKALPADDLKAMCDATWEQIVSMAEVYELTGCPVN